MSPPGPAECLRRKLPLGEAPHLRAENRRANPRPWIGNKVLTPRSIRAAQDREGTGSRQSAGPAGGPARAVRGAGGGAGGAAARGLPGHPEAAVGRAGYRDLDAQTAEGRLCRTGIRRTPRYNGSVAWEQVVTVLVTVTRIDDLRADMNTRFAELREDLREIRSLLREALKAKAP